MTTATDPLNNMHKLECPKIMGYCPSEKIAHANAEIYFCPESTALSKSQIIS